MQMLDPHGQNNGNDNRNMFVAVALAAIAILGYEYISAPKQVVVNDQAKTVIEKPIIKTEDGTALPGTPENLHADKNKIVNDIATSSEPAVKRIAIHSDDFNGSISLKGGRVDALSLPKYKTSIDSDETITLFHSGGENAHFFDAGWLTNNENDAPNGNTIWQASGNILSVGNPLVLTWSNKKGQIFKRVFTINNDSYAIEITDSIENKSANNANFTHYAQIHKTGVDTEGSGSMYDAERSSFYNFLGPMGIVDGLRVEAGYDDLKDAPVKRTATQGWIGMTSRYFIASLVPDQITPQTFLWRHSKLGNRDFYTVVMQPNEITVPAGGSVENTYTLYAGPKVASELSKVNSSLVKAIDYGWFNVISQPVHKMITWFHDILGNYGLAIIAVTIVLKMLTYPLSYKSYSAMAKMRKLQPRLAKLKERYGDNKEQFAMEMMGLYKEHKVNPLSGCWPTLIQIPIFFAFYKVLLISFEFRQAPIALWIKDMSVMDPYYVLPVLMGISMMVQMRLSPTSADPNQQMMVKIMPVIFTFMFLWFPAGLVLYWLTNNIVSILQQLYVNKKLA